MTIDPVAHAYVTIGLRPGASAEELKARYKQLVKTWHPDRWANDPANQAEATQRMRMINEAYATLHRRQGSSAVKPEPPIAQHQHPADHWSTSHRPMTKDELDAVVHAIGNESLMGGAFSFLAWFLPMAAACVPIAHTRGELLNGYKPSTPREVAISAVLFSIGVVVLIFQKYQKLVKHL